MISTKHEAYCFFINYNVKATFFLIGKNVDRFPVLAKRIAIDGHVIGNHTYSHPDLIWLNQQQIHSELLQTETSIVRATGQKPLLFRPPYGRRSPLLFPVVEDFGYKVILWSIDPVDWHAKNPSINVNLILNEVKPGSIILLHDGVEDQPRIQFDRNNTVEASPHIIEGLKTKGFCFVTIPEMLSNNLCQCSK